MGYTTGASTGRRVSHRIIKNIDHSDKKLSQVITALFLGQAPYLNSFRELRER